MAETGKNLGQAALAATTWTDVYTVPGATSARVSTIAIANDTATSCTVYMRHAIAGAANSAKQIVIPGTTIPGNETIWATVGITLAATDVLRFWSSNASVSVNIWGLEIT